MFLQGVTRFYTDLCKLVIRHTTCPHWSLFGFSQSDSNICTYFTEKPYSKPLTEAQKAKNAVKQKRWLESGHGKGPCEG